MTADQAYNKKRLKTANFVSLANLLKTSARQKKKEVFQTKILFIIIKKQKVIILS